MTLKEKVICECYTGIAFTTGDERNELYRYLRDLFGRPIHTHEIPFMVEEIKSKSEADFINVCRGLYGEVSSDKSLWQSWYTPPSESILNRNDKFLVAGRNGGKQIGRYKSSDNTWVNAANKIIHPTHWMELPESPRKGTYETENC